MKLSIGCGKDFQKTKGEDWEGLDIMNFGQKYMQDLEELGLSGIGDNSVEYIKAHNVFEHLHHPANLFVFNECWRVLKPKGILDILVPRFPTDNSVDDPTHCSFYTPKTFHEYLAGGRPSNSTAIFKFKGKWHELKKWAMISDGKGGYKHYTVWPKTIAIFLVK